MKNPLLKLARVLATLVAALLLAGCAHTTRDSSARPVRASGGHAISAPCSGVVGIGYASAQAIESFEPLSADDMSDLCSRGFRPQDGGRWSCGGDGDLPWWSGLRMPPTLPAVPWPVPSRKQVPRGNVGIGTTSPAGRALLQPAAPDASPSPRGRGPG